VRKNGIGRGLLFACLEDMRQQGYGYAIVGGVGPTAFYSKAVGAVLIEGSGTAPRLRPPILLMILLENIARTLPP
jgi:predicted N-acetyltransferase YhbS